MAPVVHGVRGHAPSVGEHVHSVGWHVHVMRRPRWPRGQVHPLGAWLGDNGGRPCVRSVRQLPARGRSHESPVPANGTRVTPCAGRGARVERRLGPHDRRAAAPAMGVRAGAECGGALPRHADYGSAVWGSVRVVCAPALVRVPRRAQRVASAALCVRRSAREEKLHLARPNCETSQRMSRQRPTIEATRMAMCRVDRTITASRRGKCQTAPRKYLDRAKKSLAGREKSASARKEL